MMYQQQNSIFSRLFKPLQVSLVLTAVVAACAPAPQTIVKPESRRSECTGKVAVLRADHVMVRYRHDVELMSEIEEKAAQYCADKNKSAVMGRQACEYSCCITAFQCR